MHKVSTLQWPSFDRNTHVQIQESPERKIQWVMHTHQMRER